MCDTFVALPSITSDGSIIFGKNSDREPNEAQSLEYHAGRTGIIDKEIQCTYIKIPEVKEKYAVLISRPFWMWGAEMGANEKGVVIGNEAVFTKIKVAKKGVLTGMDLLRLALERSGTAQQALHTVVQLLSDYGQGGLGGYEDKRIAYHNSFLIADTTEAWILETAGHIWAAKKVKEYYAISNGLTIGAEYDEAHPDIINFAKKKGWNKKGKEFHFAKAYSDWFYTTFSACKTRRQRANQLLGNVAGNYDIRAAIDHLRDHGTSNYRPDTHLLGNRVCAHAANSLSRNATQSTSSFIAELLSDKQQFWVTGTSAPCTGIYKPLASIHDLPDLGPMPNAKYNPDNLWWQHEKLHRLVLKDFRKRLKVYSSERNQLENEFIKGFNQSVDKAGFSKSAFEENRKQTEKWIELIKDLPIDNLPGIIYRNYWKKQNKYAGLKV